MSSPTADRRAAHPDLLDRLNDGVFEADASGRLNYVNRALARIHGREDPAELLGKVFLEFIAPHDRPRISEVFQRLIAQEPLDERFAVDVLRADGSIARVEVKPVAIVESGAVVRACGVVRDTSDRRATETTLQTLWNAIMNADASIVITDRKGAIEFVNPCFEKITGYARAEVLGRTTRFLKSGQHDAAFYESLWKTLLAGKPFRATFVNRRKSGELYYQEQTIAPVLDSQGAVSHFVATGCDLTPQRKLEQQLLQAQKMEAVGRLAGGVAHDFNNILTAILGYSEIAIESLRPEDPLRADLEEIERAGKRASSLTRRLLAFSRKQILQPRVVNLNSIVTDLEGMLRRLIGEHIEVVTDLAPDLGAVRIDSGQIEQVLLNLAVNSRDAMPSGGKLILATTNVRLDAEFADRHVDVRPGRFVLMSVTDTGCGMSDDVQGHLFEPFFTTKDPSKGTGLGLSTVYGIVKQSGGHISAYSEPGHGTVMKVYLPRVDDPVEPAVETPPARTVSGSETILLVEDDHALRAMARRTLESRGYRVLEADGPIRALDLAQQAPDPIHLVLSDLVMPAMNGLELCARLVSSRPSIKVLIMSGYTGTNVLSQEIRDLHYRFLIKPFSPHQLLQEVRSMLGQA